MAGGQTNVSALRGAWGGGTMRTCGSHSLSTDSCIGESAEAGNACANWKVNARTYTDEFMVTMMVARRVNNNGAYFCPTQIEGRNKNKGHAWTEYADASQGNSALCHWLCKPGYTGDECSKAVSSSGGECDSTLMLRENYATIRRVESGNNIEDAVAMFDFDKKVGCGVHRTQEHDTILAIESWLPNGHGAWVQQFIVRAERRGWSDMDSTATIYPATNAKKILVCKIGYTVNSAGTNCEPINRDACPESAADKLAALCSGWNAADYNSLIHDFKLVGSCYQLRCIQSGYAFPSSGDKSCKACTQNMRGGVSPLDGTCKVCDTGKIFNENAPSSGYCTDTAAYSKTDMLYGAGKTRNTAGDLKNHCWPLATPDEYKKCVENGTAAGVASTNNSFNMANDIQLIDVKLDAPIKPTSPIINNPIKYNPSLPSNNLLKTTISTQTLI